MAARVANLYYPAVDRVETPSPPPDVLVTDHFLVQPGYAAYRARGSGNWVVTYTVDGGGRYRQPPDIELLATPGDLVLLDPHAVHDYAVPPRATWEFLWAHFQPRPAWLTWWRLPEVGQGLFHLRVGEPSARHRVRDAFVRMDREARLATPGLPGAELQQELALNALEEGLLIAIRSDGRSCAMDSRVQRVLDHITGDLAAPHNLELLAREVSLSPSRLSHLFRDEVGDSITNLILNLRLQQAARLLEFTPNGIASIAQQVGFGSAYYFSRQFHRRFGLSPRSYRARPSSDARHDVRGR